jgi:hypothetical protein
MKTYIRIKTSEDIFKAGKCDVDTMTLKGFRLVEELFCDSSGFGLDTEPALTPHQAITKVNQLIKDNGQLYASITGQGQFQVYVGLFKKVNKPNIIRHSSNVFERHEKGKTIIRLYDTDILTFDDKTVVFNSGGFKTVTTKKWINKFLPTGYVYQKKFEWYWSKGDTLIEEGKIYKLNK